MQSAAATFWRAAAFILPDVLLTFVRQGRLHKKMKKKLPLPLHVVMIVAAAEAHAARPFVTDDARTVDVGGYQLEPFYKSQHAYSGWEFWFPPAYNPSGI